MADLFKTQTAGVGADGKPIYDVFEGERKLELPEFQQRGLNIDQIAVGQAPTGFTSQFGVITPESLTGTQPFPVANPAPSPIPVVPELTMTPQEQAQSDEISKLKEQNNLLLGKSAYQTEQDTRFGVDKVQANINDLTAQLQGIKNEAAAIPLNEQSRAAKGTILTSGLQANQNQLLRDNAVRALSVSTLLAASQGQLANAQAMADKAVAAKYDPIQEKIDALKTNLDLIIADPKTSVQDKARAQAQKDAQDAKAERVAREKEEATTVWNVATTAASNGSNFKATTTYPTLSVALDKISKAKTKEEALKIAVETGLVQDPDEVDTQIIQLDDGRDVVVDKNTGNIIKVIGGGSPGTGGTGGRTGGTRKVSELPKGTFTQTQLNKGAANAGVSAEDLKNFTYEGANAFINAMPSINAKVKEIQAGLDVGTKPSEIEASISGLSVPPEVKNYLGKYLKANAPKEKSGNWFTNLFK